MRSAYNRKLVATLTVLLTMVVAAGSFAKTIAQTNSRVDSLFTLASAGELQSRELVEPAKDSLIAMGITATPRLIEKMDSKDARERLTLVQIIAKIGAPAVPLLRRALLSERSSWRRERICWALGDMEGVHRDSARDAAPELIVAIKDPAWQVRVQALRACGRLKILEATPLAISSLRDGVNECRKSAAWALGQLSDTLAVGPLIAALDDSFFGVRFLAADALVALGSPAFDALSAVAARDTSKAGDLAAEVLGKISGKMDSKMGSGAAVKSLLPLLHSARPRRRAAAAIALGECATSRDCEAIERMRLTERNPYVMQTLAEALARIQSRP